MILKYIEWEVYFFLVLLFIMCMDWNLRVLVEWYIVEMLLRFKSFLMVMYIEYVWFVIIFLIFCLCLFFKNGDNIERILEFFSDFLLLSLK